MKKINLSYPDYRAACDEAFSANISNPSIFFNPNEGFYVIPSADLVPNSDHCLGLAFFHANSGRRSFSGTRAEYAPIARAIRKYYSDDNHKITYTSPEYPICRDCYRVPDVGVEVCVCGSRAIEQPQIYTRVKTLADYLNAEIYVENK